MKAGRKKKQGPHFQTFIVILSKWQSCHGKADIVVISFQPLISRNSWITSWKTCQNTEQPRAFFSVLWQCCPHFSARVRSWEAARGRRELRYSCCFCWASPYPPVKKAERFAGTRAISCLTHKGIGGSGRLWIQCAPNWCPACLLRTIATASWSRSCRPPKGKNRFSKLLTFGASRGGFPSELFKSFRYKA